VDTAAVLGVQQVRPSFLDDVRRSARSQAGDTAARHARSHHACAHGAETGRRRRIGRGSCHSRRQSDPYGPAPLTAMFSSPDDDDLDEDDPEDDDEEVEEDEEDDGDEEVWQVRLT
jgi:hypothetical protein